MIVEEYTELDFEHVTLDTSEHGTIETCTECHADNWVLYSGIYSCDECGTINHKDITV